MTTYLGPDGIVSSDLPNFENAGMPFTGRMSGTVTTNSSGNVSIGLNGWSWSSFGSFKRFELVMAGFWRDSGPQQIYAILMISSGATYSALARHSHSGSSSSFSGYVDFYGNLNTGQRYIRLLSASGSATYNYEIRAVHLTPAHDGSGGL